MKHNTKKIKKCKMKHNLKIKGDSRHIFYKKTGNTSYDALIYKRMFPILGTLVKSSKPLVLLKHS